MLCQATVLKHVVSSVAEAEYGAIFVNAKTGTVTRETPREMGHPQDATELKTDNTAADGTAKKTVLQKRSKAMDMRYYWIQDRIEQGQFDISWAPGDTNLGVYFTKHHSAAHHQCIRPFNIHSQTAPMIHHKTKNPVL
jgi:aryl-phospho-beta-D-glucosidase BglC (GH1 family)